MYESSYYTNRTNHTVYNTIIQPGICLLLTPVLMLALLVGGGHDIARGVGALFSSPVKRVGVHLGRAVETEPFSAHGQHME